MRSKKSKMATEGWSSCNKSNAVKVKNRFGVSMVMFDV